MFEHFIIMTSSYKKGSRIALQMTYSGGVDQNELKTVMSRLQSVSGDRVSYSTHYVCTESDEWESVVAYDPFFEDAYVVESLEEMLYLIQKDFILTGLDVAKYILSKRECTHLELEKLTYLCYADYICKYGKKLCTDDIYAFTYGPVVDSVYEQYTHHTEILTAGISEDIARSRLMVLPDGYERIKSIDATLEKYGKCSASDLVNLTHVADSPWSMKDSTRAYQVIGDELIIERHCYEEEYFEKKLQ